MAKERTSRTRRQEFATNHTNTNPVNTRKTRRMHNLRVMTSVKAGKLMPVAVIPLLREDSLNGVIHVGVEQQETVEILMNNVDVVMQAWLVPTLADQERFRTMDDVILAYNGESRKEGEPVVPFIERIAMGARGTNPVLDVLGKHAKPTDMVNAFYNVAYNLIYNHRAANVSDKIQRRPRLTKTLAQAFWATNIFSFIVPRFDQAAMQGRIALQIADQTLPVRGIGMNTTSGAGALMSRWETGGLKTPNELSYNVGEGGSNAIRLNVKADPANPGHPDISVRMNDNSVTLLLSDIDAATKAQSWAEVRKAYQGLSDEMIIDELMNGNTVPEQGWKQPILLHHGQVSIGQDKRYASDGENLTASVVNGAASMQFRIACPPVPCGGVVMITCEIMPEQLFERQEDPYLHAAVVADFPHHMADDIDPEKVEVIPNKFIDIDHDDPEDVYGYGPLNYRWNQAGPCLGGRFLRPEVDAPFDEDRQAFWAVETQNPRLTEDAYLVPADIHLKPFWDSHIDPFDVLVRGEIVITGNTVFGGLLHEETARGSNYDKVLEKVDFNRIEQD